MFSFFRFGRKPVLLVSVVILTSTGMAVAMSHNYWMFCVMYMCQGVGQVALGVAFYVHGELLHSGFFTDKLIP